MSGPYEDKQKAETNSPAKSGEVKKPAKRGPKTEGKILLTENMIKARNAMREGFNKTSSIAEALELKKSPMFSILYRMYRIGMIERVNESKTNRPEYVYTLNEGFKVPDTLKFDPIR